MKIEEALGVVYKYLPQQRLNNVQELVFCASWQGQSYLECAKTHGYSPEYIKAVGYKLWQLLSLSFQEPVTKNNFQSVLRKHSLLTQAELLNTQAKSANAQFNLTHRFKVAVDEPLTVQVRQNWEEAVDVSVFYGRAEELVTLKQWIVQERCRLVGVFGMGGMGKTALSCKLAKQIQGEFEYIFWRSLRNAPAIEDFLADLIFFLSNQQETEADLPKNVEGRISRLIDYLRRSPCLVVLDDVEAIFRSGTYAGNYREGYEGYGELFRRVGEVHHQSVLVLTSREKPREVELLEGERLPVRSLRLCGLKEAEAQAIFQDKGSFSGSPDEWQLLVQHYAGNPLALKIAASAIQKLFDSSISDFLKFLKQGSLLFDDIRHLLNSQFSRLSDLELSVMYWLAIHRKPVSFEELQADLISPSAKQELPEALSSLERRSLIENNSSKFTLQSAVMQYVTESFINQVCDEIATEEITLLISHALIKDQTRGYVSKRQYREILLSIAQQLLTFSKNSQDVECKLNRILLKLREKFSRAPGYGTQNLIHLIRQLKMSSANLDFSGLRLRQTNFRRINLHRANLAKSIFGQQLLSFRGNTDWARSVRFSPDGQTTVSGSVDN